MADRIIKSDSGNNVVIQNNAGSRKIEVTNSGDVEVTGDFKATTVKATNLKANDGTASLEVADSTGDIGFSGNTNLKIKLPSAGGIYESDGSTQVLTESGGSVTIQNATFNGTIGNSVSLNDSFGYYTMAATAAAGTASVQFSSHTDVLNNSDFYSSSFSANTLTITIAQAGYYKISNSFYAYGSNQIPQYVYNAVVTGTATKYGLAPSGKIGFDSGTGQKIASFHGGMELTFLVLATASQTIALEPHYDYTQSGSGNFLYGSNIAIQKVK